MNKSSSIEYKIKAVNAKHHALHRTETFYKLANLTMTGGRMRSALIGSINSNKLIIPATVAFNESNDFLGWCLYIPNETIFNCRDRASIHTYVSPGKRRHGIGKALVSAMSLYLKDDAKIRGHGWDRQSALFYESIDVNII